MPEDIMNRATAVAWGSFVQAAYKQFASDPGQINPATIEHLPAGYELVRTIQMTDFLGPERSRVFYGFVAVGGDPATAVVALRVARLLAALVVLAPVALVSARERERWRQRLAILAWHARGCPVSWGLSGVRASEGAA